MKNRILILFSILIFLVNILFAQTNLVPNGDFELYSSLPTGNSQSNRVIGWNNVNGNYSGATGSPDYFNLLSYSPIGSITPCSGKGQMGLITYQLTWREYISTQFTTPMISGHHYLINFYLTNGTGFESYTKASNNFGVHFSNNPLHQNTSESISVTPQIEIDTIIYFWNYWQHFSFHYFADSSYNYITIGNFRDDANTLISSFGNNGAYYFIDKIEVIPILNIIGDSTICKGDTASLMTTVGNTIKWATAQQPNIIIYTDTILKVNPNVTTTYLAYNPTDTASFTVNVVNPPNINFGSDVVLCDGSSVILNATQTSATYQWQDNSINSNFLVTQAGSYWVVAKVNENCWATDSITISYRSCDFPEVFIPNAFTPDGDDLNDVFSIYTEVEFSSFNIKIFNRREQQIYESDDAHFRWDATFKGSPVSLGAYMYYIQATDKLSNKKLSFKGRISVLY